MRICVRVYVHVCCVLHVYACLCVVYTYVCVYCIRVCTYLCICMHGRLFIIIVLGYLFYSICLSNGLPGYRGRI